MPEFFIRAAFKYYDKHINRTERFNLLESHNLSVTGSVPSIDWELFGSLLTGEKASDGYGADLESYEIKSASGKGSFEYQYHRNGGKDKLLEDMTVDHMFISYSKDYQNVTVRLVSGKTLTPTFQSWMPGLVKNYSGTSGKQRYRKSISYGAVETNGRVIMEIKDGKLISQ